MKQRLAIASAMIGDPQVLIFDEPTNGLDPQGIAEVRETIHQIASTGKTIIMASHILDEVEKICSHVAIIKNGNLLATGSVGSIINDEILIEVGASDKAQLRTFLQQLPHLSRLEETDFGFLLYLTTTIPTADINRKAFAEGVILTHLRQRQKSLEAEFLEITNQN
jgi:ABC-2 type transport system ATP-binding protein